MVSLFELHSRSGKGGTPCPSPIDERNVTKGKKQALKRLRKGGKKQVEEAGGGQISKTASQLNGRGVSRKKSRNQEQE